MNILKNIPVLILALVLVSACDRFYSEKKQPTAKEGVLDLRGWNLESDGSVELKGDWDFYWKQLLNQESFTAASAPGKTGLFNIPDHWNGHVVQGETLSGFGYATFRLRVYLDPGQAELALRCPDAGMAFGLYVNGRLLCSNGRVASTKSNMVAWRQPGIVFFRKPGETLDIQLQVSNFHHRLGGPWAPIQLGRNVSLKQERERDISLVLFLTGNLVIMGLYHLGVFFMRRKDRSPLYFGLFCLLIALRSLITGERFLISIFPALHWEFYLKLEYITLVMPLSIFGSFLNGVLPRLLNRRVMWGLWITGSLLSLLTLFSRPALYSYTFLWYYFVLIFGILYMLFFLLMATLRKREGATIFFLGAVALSIAIINDLLVFERIIRTGTFLPLGLFLFIFSQAYFLISRSSRAFVAVDELTNVIEGKVIERTREVEAGREQLEGLSEVSRRVSAAGDLPSVFTVVHHALMDHLGPLAVWLLLVDQKRRELYTDRYQPIPGSEYSDETHRFLKGFRVPLKPESGTLFRTYKKKRAFFLERINHDWLQSSLVDDSIVKSLKLKSFVHLPLIVQDEIIGILCIVDPATTHRKDLPWLGLFANQTAGAVHSASLLSGAERAREEIHDLNRFSRRINQTTDMDAVLEDLFAHFQNTFGIEGCVVCLHEPDTDELYVLKYSEPMARFKFEEKVQQLLRFPLEPSVGTLYSTFHRRKPFYLRHAQLPLQRGRAEGIDSLILETLGVSEILQVPLVIQNQSIGILCLIRLEEPMFLSKAEIRSIERTCEQIAGAIYRSFLYKQLLEAGENAEDARKRAEQARGELTKLNQFSRKINESPHLEYILRDVFEYFDSEFDIDAVTLQLVDRATNELYTYRTSEPLGVNSGELDYARKLRVPLNHTEGGILFQIFERQKPYYHARIDEDFVGRATPLVREIVNRLNFSSILLVPLVIRNESIGMLLCTSYVKKFRVNRTDVGSISRFCEQVAGAIYSSFLFQQLEEKTKDLALLNESLQKMDRVKTRFFSNISHAFRTPLTLILAPVESILKGDFGESVRKNNVTFKPILRNGQRLLRLINNLLDYTRIEAGRMSTNKVRTDMNVLLEYYMANVMSEAEAKNLNLTFTNKSDGLIADIDRDLMEKAIMNLLSNAFKFTAPGGDVKIELDDDSETHFSLSIHDSGIGVEADKLETIFDRFSQVDDSVSRKNEGTGIGLSLTREIIELHGGNIKVESEAGKGTVFSIILPKGPEGEPVAPKEMDEVKAYLMADLRETPAQEPESVDLIDSANPGNSLDYSILMVEDNADMRSFLNMLLEREYTVFSAVNGAEGLAKTRELMPDLILADVMMPEMDGYEMTQKLKSAGETRDIPVILLSAKADVSNRVEGLAFGADDYLTKPFNSEELMARIRNQIASKKLERELKKKKELRDKEFFQASLIQKNILTSRDFVREIEELEIDLAYLPMNGVVSGDYYNISRMNKGIASVFLADATGHGTQAALSTMQIDMLYREHLDKKYPDEVFEFINRKFVSELHSKNYFTGIIVDILADRIRYSSAGHPEQYLIPAGGTEIRKLRTKGWMIGMRPEQDYEMEEIETAKGDILLLFSDGIFEVFNAEGEEFGEERFFALVQEGILNGWGKLPMSVVIERILGRLDEYRGEVGFRDDITLIGVRVK